MSATRPVQCLDRPIVHPNVCIQCGSQHKDYFVDLGMDVPNDLFQPLWDGALYFCCECMENLMNDYIRARDRYLEERDGPRVVGETGMVEQHDGSTDGVSNSVDESSDVINGDQSQSESPIAATLDSSAILSVSF